MTLRDDALRLAKEADTIVFARRMRRGSNEEIIETLVRLAKQEAYEEAASLCDRFHARMMVPAECAAAIRKMANG